MKSCRMHDPTSLFLSRVGFVRRCFWKPEIPRPGKGPVVLTQAGNANAIGISLFPRNPPPPPRTPYPSPSTGAPLTFSHPRVCHRRRRASSQRKRSSLELPGYISCGIYRCEQGNKYATSQSPISRGIVSRCRLLFECGHWHYATVQVRALSHRKDSRFSTLLGRNT